MDQGMEAGMMDQEEVAPRKRGIPTWLWVCGSGCLLATIAAIALVAFGFSVFKKGTDPEIQWPKIQKLLPFEERPEELELQFGMNVGIEMYVLSDTRGYVVMLFHGRPDQAAELREQMLNVEVSGSVMGMGGRKDLREASLEVQGRTLQGLRFNQAQGEGAAGGNAGESIMLELTSQESSSPIILQMVRAGGSAEITDDEVRTFLEDFDLSELP